MNIRSAMKVAPTVQFGASLMPPTGAEKRAAPKVVRTLSAPVGRRAGSSRSWRARVNPGRVYGVGHHHSGPLHWPPFVAYQATARELGALIFAAPKRSQYVMYGSDDHVEPLLACCACGQVKRYEGDDVCAGCGEPFVGHESIVVTVAAGELVRVFGRKERPRSGRSRSRSRSRGRKEGARGRSGSRGRKPRAPKKAAARQAVAVKAAVREAATLVGGKAPRPLRREKPAARSVAGPKVRPLHEVVASAFILPEVAGDMRIPVGGVPVPTGVGKLEETYVWNSYVPGTLAPADQMVTFIPENEGFAVLTRDPLVPLRMLTYDGTPSALAGLGYRFSFPSLTPGGPVGDEEVVAQTDFYIDSAQFAVGDGALPTVGETISLPISYLEAISGSTFQPFGAFTPAFVDTYETARDKTYFFAQTGIEFSCSCAQLGPWTAGVDAIVTLTLFAWNPATTSEFVAGSTTFTVSSGGGSTGMDINDAGYYRLEVRVATATAGAPSGAGLTFAASLTGAPTMVVNGTQFVSHYMSPDLANAINAQFSDIRGVGTAVCATQAGQNLARNGTVAFRQFSSDVSFLSLIGEEATTGLTGNFGFKKLTSAYPDYLQIDLVEGWNAWVKPDDLVTNGFKKALRVDSSGALLAAYSSLRDLGWVGVSWALDDTVATSLSVKLRFGFEYVTTDKTRDVRCPALPPSEVIKVQDYLAGLKPSEQFSHNPDHLFSALGDIVGAGLGGIGSMVGGGVGDAFKGAGTIARYGGQLASILGNLIG